METRCRRANSLYSYFAASWLLQSESVSEATGMKFVCNWNSLCSASRPANNYAIICEEPWNIFTSCWTDILLESNVIKLMVVWKDFNFLYKLFQATLTVNYQLHTSWLHGLGWCNPSEVVKTRKKLLLNSTYRLPFVSDMIRQRKFGSLLVCGEK